MMIGYDRKIRQLFCLIFIFTRFFWGGKKKFRLLSEKFTRNCRFIYLYVSIILQKEHTIFEAFENFETFFCSLITIVIENFLLPRIHHHHHN